MKEINATSFLKKLYELAGEKEGIKVIVTDISKKDESKTIKKVKEAI